jgi:hypothetical protein
MTTSYGHYVNGIHDVVMKATAATPIAVRMTKSYGAEESL